MQEHRYFVDIDASVDELWQLFWARIPHTETGDVTIDIVYRGNERCVLVDGNLNLYGTSDKSRQRPES